MALSRTEIHWNFWSHECDWQNHNLFGDTMVNAFFISKMKMKTLLWEDFPVKRKWKGVCISTFRGFGDIQLFFIRWGHTPFPAPQTLIFYIPFIFVALNTTGSGWLMIRWLDINLNLNFYQIYKFFAEYID